MWFRPVETSRKSLQACVVCQTPFSNHHKAVMMEVERLERCDF